VMATTPNDGLYNDSTGISGQASFTYTVCEAGTQNCSNEVTVRFPRYGTDRSGEAITLTQSCATLSRAWLN
jgi:hypothetical protein